LIPTNNLQTKAPFNSKQKERLPWKRKPVSGLFYWLVSFILRLIFRINGGVDIIGRSNIPLKGGVIIASNHISYLDPPLLGAILPRRATFIARRGLFGIPLLGWLIKHAAFPIDREKTHPSTIKEAVRRLRNGELLVMFPEGRRSDTGRLLEGKRGTGMIARLSRASIVPTLIIGSNKALPVDAKWIKRARISVIFDKPVDPSTIYGKGDDLSEVITQRIMSSIKGLEERYADPRG
jgi:1-acyl-sn-glycerol-3-phosphate acyltransferase